MNAKTLGENIRFYRWKAKMTQAELASEIQRSANLIPRWERGEIQPKAENIPLLAEALGITASELLGDTFTKQSEYSDKTKIEGKEPSMAYWGTVVDNAEKAAQSGKNIKTIIELLGIALDTLKVSISKNEEDSSKSA